MFLAALFPLFVVGAALGASAVNDPRDTAGKLDIRSASLQLVKGRVVATIATHGSWTSGDLGSRRQRSVCMRLWTKSQPPRIHDYSICAERVLARGGPVGTIYRHGSIESPSLKIGPALLTRPDSRTVTLSFPPARIGNPAVLQWQASSFSTEFDLAPDKSPVRQAIR